MAIESADWPGVANSDERPREDFGVVSASGISRSRGRSTTSCGGEPCPTKLLCVRGIRQNSGKRPPASGAGSRLSALDLILRVLEWEGGWGIGAVASDGEDVLKMAKFGHVGLLGGPGVEEGVRTGLIDNGVTLGFPRRAALAGSAWPSTGRRWRKREARRREAAAVGPICKASRARLLRHKGATSSRIDLM